MNQLPKHKTKPRFLQGFGTVGQAAINVWRQHDKVGFPVPRMYITHWAGGGNTVYNLGLEPHHGTFESTGPVWEAGKFGICNYFDGSDDYITVTSNVAAFSPATTPFTMISYYYHDFANNTESQQYTLISSTGDLGYTDSSNGRLTCIRGNL